jgi:DNA-binding beta-propeller fold protein YncE
MAAVGEHALWFATPYPAVPSRVAVLEIDPRRSLSSAAVVPVVNQFYGWVVADPAGAWYAGQATSVVLLVDGSTKGVDKRVRLPSQFPGGPAMALGERALWVGHSTGVSRIDTRTGKILATIPVGPTPDAVAAGEGGVWAAVHPGSP